MPKNIYLKSETTCLQEFVNNYLDSARIKAINLDEINIDIVDIASRYIVQYPYTEIDTAAIDNAVQTWCANNDYDKINV